MSDSENDAKNYDFGYNSDEEEEEMKRKAKKEREEAEEEYKYPKQHRVYLEPDEPEEPILHHMEKCLDSTKPCSKCQRNDCDWIFLPCDHTYHDRCLYETAVHFQKYKYFSAMGLKCPCGESGVAPGSGGAGASGSGGELAGSDGSGKGKRKRSQG